MIIKDFRCKSCNSIDEYYVESDCNKVECRKCGNDAGWYPSISGAFKEDATWIRSVLDVVDKESKKSHVKEFLQYPTRQNYRRWMKGERIRPVEGESDMRKPFVSRKEGEFAKHRLIDELCKKRMERRSIEVRG